MFDKEKFDDLCWMMTSKKNFNVAAQRLSERDCFKLFCLFNLLSEDRYPLVMIPEEVNSVKPFWLGRGRVPKRRHSLF